jgi:hypothetical protein
MKRYKLNVGFAISQRRTIMKRFVVSALSLTLILAVQAALAQAPAQPPKPGPEVKRLAYFVGKWTSEGDMKQSPFGPAGKATMTETSEWLPGGFFIKSQAEGRSPMGEMKSTSIMGYDPEAKVYTYSSFDNMGHAEHGRGTVKGDTWTWTSESEMGGKLIKSRFILKEVSPTSYSYKWESMSDAGSWMTIMEGKATKAK